MATLSTYTTTNNSFFNYTTTSTAGNWYNLSNNIIYYTTNDTSATFIPTPPRICTIEEHEGVDGSWVTTEFDSRTGTYFTRWLGSDKAEYSRKAKSKADALAFHKKWVQTNITIWEKTKKCQKRTLLL